MYIYMYLYIYMYMLILVFQLSDTLHIILLQQIIIGN